MRTHRSLLAACLLAVTVLASPHAQAADPVLVEINLYQYTPAVVVVASGQPITWHNGEVLGVAHNVVILTKDAGLAGQTLVPTLAPGQSATVTAGEPQLPPGTYTYTCTIGDEHTALMHGVLVVQ